MLRPRGDRAAALIRSESRASPAGSSPPGQDECWGDDRREGSRITSPPSLGPYHSPSRSPAAVPATRKAVQDWLKAAEPEMPDPAGAAGLGMSGASSRRAAAGSPEGHEALAAGEAGGWATVAALLPTEDELLEQERLLYSLRQGMRAEGAGGVPYGGW